jgi:hypothetical protein
MSRTNAHLDDQGAQYLLEILPESPCRRKSSYWTATTVQRKVHPRGEGPLVSALLPYPSFSHPYSVIPSFSITLAASASTNHPPSAPSPAFTLASSSTPSPTRFPSRRHSPERRAFRVRIGHGISRDEAHITSPSRGYSTLSSPSYNQHRWWIHVYKPSA